MSLTLGCGCDCAAVAVPVPGLPGPAGPPGELTAPELAHVARHPDTIWFGPITLDAFGAPLSAAVTWPDGSAGVYTGTASVAFPGSIDSWTITHADGPFLFTQPTVTRNGSGMVTVQPAIVIT